MPPLFIIRFWLGVQGEYCKNGPCSEFCQCTFQKCWTNSYIDYVHPSSLINVLIEITDCLLSALQWGQLYVGSNSLWAPFVTFIVQLMYCLVHPQNVITFSFLFHLYLTMYASWEQVLIYNCDLAKIKQSSATQTTTQSYTCNKQAYSQQHNRKKRKSIQCVQMAWGGRQ